MNPFKTLVLLCAALASAAVLAHGDAHVGARGKPPAPQAAPEQTPWGIAGQARHARTIEIRMTDAMRFSPDRIELRQGETVRFVVRNGGKLMHEMVIGTPKALDSHAEMMKQYPGMEHDEAYMAHVPAGRRGDIVWTFNRAGTFQFACLIAGHYQAGMVGTIVVTPAANEESKS